MVDGASIDLANAIDLAIDGSVGTLGSNAVADTVGHDGDANARIAMDRLALVKMVFNPTNMQPFYKHPNLLMGVLDNWYRHDCGDRVGID